MKTVAGMPPRKPIALALVCAAHAVLGLALLALGTDRIPSGNGTTVQDGLRLVSVRLVPRPPTAVTPMASRHADEARAPSLRTLPVQPVAAADTDHPALSPVPAPSIAAATTSAAAEPVVPNDAPPAAAIASERAVAAAPAQAQPAPPAPAAAAPHGGDAPPVVAAQADRRHCPSAPHPAALRERGIEGAVMLRVKVDVQGRPTDVQVLAGSGWRLFDEAAQQQVRACRFIPARRDGQAIDSWVEFPVRFALAG
jgi:periplasmic protein TonB